MKKVSKYMIATLAAVGIIGSVSACQHGRFGEGVEHRAEHGARIMKKITRKLDLNENQQAALQNLHSSMQERMDENQSPPKEEFMALFGTQFDQNKAIAMLQDKTARMNANAPELVTKFAAFYDSLDADQQAKVIEFVEKRGGRGFFPFGSHRGHHAGHHKRGAS